MKTISIHGIDKETEKTIKERAKNRGTSVNKVVKEIIAESLGLKSTNKERDNRKAFAELCGIWTEEEAERFLESLSGLEAVDPGEWR